MRRRIVTLVIFVIAVAMIAIFLDSSVFVIRNVSIVGDSGMYDDDFVRMAGVDFGGKMRKADVESIVRNVEMNGALRCISVDKDYPSTVVITVEQRRGRFVAEVAGNIVLMDENGYVMSVGRAIPEGNFLYVTGLSAGGATPGRLINADHRRIEAMCSVGYAMDACGAGDYISELNVDDLDNLYLYSRTGIHVLLGDSGEMENKMVWTKYAVQDLESRGETSGKLDVTGGNQADYSAQ